MEYDEAIERYDPVMGLEVHVELGTVTKMFCGCSTTFGAEPNTQVCPICLALPGAMPTINQRAVEYAIRIGLALNCQIASWCRMSRKNYFYPDMPKNYQISQYDEPIAFGGYLDVDLGDGSGETFRVEIERAHMEEDTGKSLHVGGSTGRIQGAEYSLLDYNRAGVPLVEIVTKPIFGTKEKAPAVARAYVGALRDLLASLDVSDVRMDQGSLRCDANLSLTPAGNPVMGTRTETKNVNSLRSVERAVRYEITRQGARLAAGQTVKQETRHFDESTGTTNPGRSKETAEDYRYFPEPDLVPIAPDPAWVESIRAALPELPWVRRARLQEAWGLTDLEMRDLLAADAVDLVEATVAAGASPAEARSWWSAYLGQQANVLGVSLPELAITPVAVGPGHRAGLRRCAERQDRPSGDRRGAGRRGRAGRGGGRPRAGRGLRRLGVAGRDRRGARRPASRGRSDPRWQPEGRRRDRRRRHEGDQGSGRRRPGQRSGADHAGRQG